MNIPVYLEVGSKRTFAGALDWPGWSRSGKDEALALEALLNYGLRYAAVVRPARLGFQAPADVSEFEVAQRLDGDTTTNMGTPGRIPPADTRPMDDAELRRLQTILKACWRVFDEAVEASKGKTLRVGPRGGGRNRQKIVEHVVGAEHAYLSRLGVKLSLKEDAPVGARLEEYRMGRPRRAGGFCSRRVAGPRPARRVCTGPPATSPGAPPGTSSITPGKSKIDWSEAQRAAVLMLRSRKPNIGAKSKIPRLRGGAPASGGTDHQEFSKGLPDYKINGNGAHAPLPFIYRGGIPAYLSLRNEKGC